MKPDDITISGGRYWSVKLHGDEHPRKVGGLLKCDHGTYTATVDGLIGVLTIAADGWWFTQAETQPQEPVITPPLCDPWSLIAHIKVDQAEAHQLLRHWLNFDTGRVADLTPPELRLRTRQFLARFDPFSPAKPGTRATHPEAPAHAS